MRLLDQLPGPARQCLPRSFAWSDRTFHELGERFPRKFHEIGEEQADQSGSSTWVGNGDVRPRIRDPTRPPEQRRAIRSACPDCKSVPVPTVMSRPAPSCPVPPPRVPSRPSCPVPTAGGAPGILPVYQKKDPHPAGPAGDEVFYPRRGSYPHRIDSDRRRPSPESRGADR
jgi:hypothetical protein